MHEKIHENEFGLGFLLNDVSRLLRRDFERRVAPLGLTMTQWRAIAQLSRCQGVRQNVLAELLDVQPISMTRLIDRMADAGWVERRPDPEDRRAVRLFLTEKVDPLLAAMWSHAMATRETALAGMSDDARRRLLRTLAKMKQNLGCTEPASPGEDKSGGR